MIEALLEAGPALPVLSAWPFLVLLASAAYLVAGILWPLYRNIQAAEATRLPYVVVPYYHYNFLIARLFGRPLLRLLDSHSPTSSVTSWRALVASLWPLKLRHAPFKAFGCDTFIIVSPGGFILNTADAAVNDQILGRNGDFPKATQIYDAIRIYGENLLSADSSAMRHHRKFMNPAFGDKTNHLVWEETLDRTQVMVQLFRGPDGQPKTVKKIDDHIKRLSLGVLGRAGLGEKLEWSNPIYENRGEATLASRVSSEKPGIADSLEYIMTNVISVMTIKSLPRWIQSFGRMRWYGKALQHYEDWGKYMREMIQAKRQAVDSGRADPSAVDLIGQFLKGQTEDAGRKPQRSTLNDNEVLGNLFALIVAGHETSANTIYHALIYLALDPQIQSVVQKSIQNVLEDRPSFEWNYEQDYSRLRKGLLGAVMNETLRLTSPVLTIPKNVSASAGPLDIDGKQVSLPANALIRVCTPAAHRNPRFWPHGSPAHPEKPIFPLDNLDNDLEEFKPDRWLIDVPGLDGTRSLFTPVRGSYVPFSDGQRACLGRRFAEVEIIATLAVLLSRYSVELAVDEWANDDEISIMSRSQRRAAWSKACQRAQDTMQNKMTCVITVQLQKDTSIPLRFIAKGQERFFDV